MEKKQLLFIVFFMFLILGACFVSAQDTTAKKSLVSVFEELSKLGFLDVYNDANANGPISLTVDFILFLILFIGITQFALSERFEGRGGATVRIMLGIILALGATFAEQSYRFRLAKLGQIWFFVFLVIIVYMLYTLFKGMDMMSGKTGRGIFMVLIYALLNVMGSKVEQIISGWTPALGSLYAIMKLILLWGGIILIIMGVINAFKANPEGDEADSAQKNDAKIKKAAEDALKAEIKKHQGGAQ